MNKKKLIVLLGLVVLLYENDFVRYLIRRRAILFAQVVDASGILSSLYMPNISCSGCGHIEARYIIDARTNIDCSFDHEMFLIILTLSRAENVERRHAIRQTWGGVGGHRGQSVRTFFICGRSSNSTEQENLSKEAKYWGDIVQVGFELSACRQFLSVLALAFSFASVTAKCDLGENVLFIFRQNALRRFARL